MPLVLASASPRRQELLKSVGIEFVVQPAGIPEVRQDHESPKAFAERLASEKARAVWQGFVKSRSSNRSKVAAIRRRSDPTNENLVLGADTVVVIGDEVLGKPLDERDAARMLRLLSGRGHSVITGVCLIGDGFEDTRSETTAVYFNDVSEPDISEYVRSAEPMDKAGAYAIQGCAARWISKIEGDYNNVVGLPVDLVKTMLREHGIA